MTYSTGSCADCKYLLMRMLLEMRMEEDDEEFPLPASIEEKPFCMYHGMYIGWMGSHPEKGCQSFEILEEVEPILTLYPPDDNLRSFAIVDENCPGCSIRPLLINVEPYCGGIGILCQNCGLDLVSSQIGDLILRWFEDENKFQRTGEEIFIFSGKLEE